MQVKKLEFDLDEDLEQFRGSLLYAVNKNSSLTQGCNGEKRYLDVNREFDFTDLFSEEEDGKLNYYAERNVALSQWIESSSSVPTEAWPRALAAARVTGPGTVYRILKAMGNSVGPVEGKRKRKRPILYTPSF
jgi:hypothetical protein